jgi:hypothetical protein
VFVLAGGAVGAAACAELDLALVEVLGRNGDLEAQQAARALRGGDEFTFYAPGSTPTKYLATIYRRRAEHVRGIGLDARGLDAAVTGSRTRTRSMRSQSFTAANGTTQCSSPPTPRP